MRRAISANRMPASIIPIAHSLKLFESQGIIDSLLLILQSGYGVFPIYKEYFYAL